MARNIAFRLGRDDVLDSSRGDSATHSHDTGSGISRAPCGGIGRGNVRVACLPTLAAVHGARDVDRGRAVRAGGENQTRLRGVCTE